MPSNPVSLTRWTKTSEVKPSDGAEVLFRFNGETFAGHYQSFVGLFRTARGDVDDSNVVWWAELPTLNENGATVDDLRFAVGLVESNVEPSERAAAQWGNPDGARGWRPMAARLRALLPEEDADAVP